MAWHHTICESEQGTRFCENELVTGDFDAVVTESAWTPHKGRVYRGSFPRPSMALLNYQRIQ